MANTLTINTRLINLNWTTATNYTIKLGSDLVREVGGNRSPSPAVDNLKVFTSFSTFPSYESVAPAYNSTGSYITTASITFDRPLSINTTTYNVLLYKKGSGSDSLIATIPSTDSRIVKNNKTITIDLRNLLEGASTYYLAANSGIFIDMFKFPAPALTESIFKYSTAAGPQVVRTSPTNGTTGTFETTASIFFDRNMFFDTQDLTRNITVKTSTGTDFLKFYSTSTGVSIVSTALNVSLLSKPMPEGEYYINYSDKFVRDQFTFPATAISNSSTFRWKQTSISNMSSRRYQANSAYQLFTATTPQVLDVDLNSSKQYTFTLNSTSGTFTSTNGVITGTTWVYQGTKSQINTEIPNVRFTRSEANRNNDITFNYTLTKDGTLLVNNTYDLIGIPFPLASPLTLTISQPRIIDEGITFTASVSTATQLNGTVEFKSDGVVIATAPINIAGVASTVTAIASTGTKAIFASFIEPTTNNGDRYETLNSTVQQIFVDLGQRLSTGTLVLSSLGRITAGDNSNILNVSLNTSTVFTGTESGRVSLANSSFKAISSEIVAAKVVNSVPSTGDGFNGNFEPGYIQLETLDGFNFEFGEYFTLWFDLAKLLSDNNLQPQPTTFIANDMVITEVDTVNKRLYLFESSESTYSYSDILDDVAEIANNLSVTSADLSIYFKLLSRGGFWAANIDADKVEITTSYATSSTTQTYSPVRKITTATFVNNTASYSLGTLASGEYAFYADWEGRPVAPKYYGQTSTAITQTILPKVKLVPRIDPKTKSFTYYNVDRSINTCSVGVSLSNWFDENPPTGTITLNDGATQLASTSTFNKYENIRITPTSRTTSPTGHYVLNFTTTASLADVVFPSGNSQASDVLASNLQLYVNGVPYNNTGSNTSSVFYKIISTGTSKWLEVWAPVEFNGTGYPWNQRGDSGDRDLSVFTQWTTLTNVTVKVIKNVNTSWNTLVWEPSAIGGQLDSGARTLTMSYSGDTYNFSTSTTSTFIGITKATITNAVVLRSGTQTTGNLNGAYPVNPVVLRSHSNILSRNTASSVTGWPLYTGGEGEEEGVFDEFGFQPTLPNYTGTITIIGSTSTFVNGSPWTGPSSDYDAVVYYNTASSVNDILYIKTPVIGWRGAGTLSKWSPNYNTGTVVTSATATSTGTVSFGSTSSTGLHSMTVSADQYMNTATIGKYFV
jgi:hypothetical protein